MGDEHEGGSASDRGREMDGKENEIKVELDGKLKQKKKAMGIGKMRDKRERGGHMGRDTGHRKSRRRSKNQKQKKRDANPGHR
jgi:hypothetical protein